jgi:Rrf2 family protein
MFFSKRCNYGLRAILYLAARDMEDGNVSIRDIAEELELPFHFLTKILQDLGGAGLVTSSRGVSGGVRLAVPPPELNVLQVVDALEGRDFLRGCVLGFEECSGKNPCVLHEQWKAMREELQNMFSGENLERVAKRMGKKRNHNPSDAGMNP